MGYYQDCKCQDFEVYSKGKENFIVLKTDEIFIGNNGKIDSEDALKDELKPCSFYRFSEVCHSHDAIVGFDAELIEVSRLTKGNWYSADCDEAILYITPKGEIQEYDLFTEILKTEENTVELYERKGKYVLLTYGIDKFEIEPLTSMPFEIYNGRWYAIINGELIGDKNQLEIVDTMIMNS